MVAILNPEDPRRESDIAIHKAREAAARIRQILAMHGRHTSIAVGPVVAARGFVPKDKQEPTAHMVRVQGGGVDEDRIGSVRILFFYNGEILALVNHPMTMGYQLVDLKIDIWISERFSKRS